MNDNNPSPADIKFMRAAITEAEKYRGMTSPNPAVGAVIVNGNKIISRGSHLRAGLAHAEVDAIAKLDYKIPENSTLYVTLEPCSHYGKTPPCADLIIKCGFARVVIGAQDINPLVNDKGADKIKSAGSEVVSGILENECRAINEDFFYAVINKKPFITVKCGLSLDGRIATAGGDSKWITNEKSRKFAHYLRKINFAVMIGANTLINDNPALNIRLYRNKYKNSAKIIILDTQFRITADFAVIKNNPPENIYIAINQENANIIKEREFIGRGINILKFPVSNSGLFDLRAITGYFYKLGFNSILIEGGGRLIYQSLKSGIVDKLHFMFAPIIIGDGIPAVNGLLTDAIHSAIKIEKLTIRRFGEDFMATGYIRH